MWVFLNGKFVAEQEAVVSVFDRSFRYGDGMFEAVLALNGKVFRWPQHWERLQQSAAFLKIHLPCSAEEMLHSANELLRRNDLKDAVLRLQVSRGSGPRGYAPAKTEMPVIVMTAHAAPLRDNPVWKLVTSPLRVAANDPLQGHKTANRLLQVMSARHARECDADESVLINTDGHVTEGSTSNLFWIRKGIVCTPPLALNILPGVTRAAIFDLCREFDIACEEQLIGINALFECEGVFLTLTSRGVVEAGSLDGKLLKRSALTERLRAGFEALLARECE